ncbi:MAG: HAD family hydrolase, partial [Candidatus Omnitrophota bacterium]|nr:HAD family hydrolase [Candidatus Omnitrophota bacterium]
ILKKPLGRAEFNRLCEGFAELVEEAVIAAPYVKGAIEFLVRNASRYKYFLLSATPKEELAEILSRRGIKRLFSRIYGAPDKKADVIKNVLSRERIAPHDALYVGDAASDYAAARRNGVRFIARASKKISAFKNVDCIKIGDLTHLEESIGRI